MLARLIKDRSDQKRYNPATALLRVCGGKSATRVTPADVSEACDTWAHLQPQTRIGYNSGLRQILALLGVPYRAWLGIPHVKSPGARQVTVEDADFERTLAQADSGLAFALLACRDCALRSGTVWRLTAASFHDGYITTKTKNGTVVTVPTSPRLEALLAASRVTGDSETPIIETLTGLKPRDNTGAMSRRLRKAQKAAGTAGWTWHDLRRTAAHRLYKATGDLRPVRDLLGHGQLSTSLIYLNAQRNPITPGQATQFHSRKETPTE